ncbi:hypothetical protein ACQJBY_021728 [Aegilops geniculata]
MEFAQKLLQLSNMEISLSKLCLMLLLMKLHRWGLRLSIIIVLFQIKRALYFI